MTIELEPRLVGTAVLRRDAREILSGKAKYAADLDVPGTVHMAVVRSTCPHGRIVGVDAEAARRVRGVLQVATGESLLASTTPIPHNLDPAGIGGKHADIRCLAVDKVRFVGEPVAAVVAESEADARAAAAVVRVTYEPLTMVLDAEAALADDAPLLYDEWGTNEMVGLRFGDGDFPAAVKRAGRTLEGRVEIHRSTSAPIEPRTYIASWEPDARRLDWYGTTQNPHPLRWVLSQALGLDESRIHVVATQSGGSFGLKMHGHPEEVLVAALSMTLHRPVRWVESREECLLAGGREVTHRFRVAFDASGRIHGVDDEVVANHGAASAGPGWGMAFVGSIAMAAGYDIPVCQVRTRVAVTNKSPWTGVRGFGKDSATTVMERIVELVAEAAGVDAAEVRRRNLVGHGRFPYTTATGLELDSGDYVALLDAVLAEFGRDSALEQQKAARSEGRHLGIGIAFELTPEGADIPGALVGGMDTTHVRMNPSGQVEALTGITSPGNGNDTVIAQVVADELGVDLDQVEVVQGDSVRCPFGYGNLSSRSAVAGGGSARLAARDLAAKLRTVAAAMLHADDADGIVLAAGFARRRDDQTKAVPIPAVAHAVYSLGFVLATEIEPILEATRTYRPSNIRHHADANGRINPFHTFAYAAHALMVEVDVETGAVTVLRHVVGHDCGTMLNPALVDGQVHGSVAAGLGAALSEELRYDDGGQPLARGFKTYLMLRAPDLPPLKVIHRCTPSPFTLDGAKGAGESGLGGAQAAALNAVTDALRPLGALPTRLPLSPANLLAAIDDASRTAG